MSLRKAMLLGVLVSAGACSSDDDDDAATTTTTNQSDSAGLVMQDISNTVSSLAIDTSTTSLAGTANDYCNGNGGAIANSTEISNSDANYAGGLGYCVLTHNAQSPDNVRGVIYLSSAIGCLASNAGVFDGLTAGNSNSTTLDATIDTTCFGNAQEVANMIEDMGSSTISGLAITATQLAADAAYDYTLNFVAGDDVNETIYIKNSDGIRAALSNEGWFIKLDTSGDNAVVLYEGIDSNNTRRIRARIVGTLDADNNFSTVESASGFNLEGSDGSFSTLATFTGTNTLGYLGMTYLSGADDVTNSGSGNCYLPGGTGTCTGLTAIAASDANGEALASAISTAKTALGAYTSTILDFTTIDPTDSDLTQ